MLTNKESPSRQFAEYFYDCLIGQVRPEYSIPWAENLFEPGKPCYESYQRALDAYARLRQRLGSGPEDADVEQIIDALLHYSQSVGVKMFESGMRYQSMIDHADLPAPDSLPPPP